VLATFAALAEPTRFRIVESLLAEPSSVGRLCERVGAPQVQVSKHLRVLRESGLVDVEAVAQSRVYSVRGEKLREIDDWLERYRSLWDARLDALETLARALDRADRPQSVRTPTNRSRPVVSKRRPR
jgi:DNA-binding transcriptional ArsR family regulator